MRFFFLKCGYSSWIAKRKGWMRIMCLLILTLYINMEPLYWLSRTFSKRDCAVGWDPFSDCFSCFINGFSFSCLADSQKGIFHCKPSPSLLALQQRKGKELNNCSHNYLCIRHLWVQKANILWDTYMLKKGLFYLFLKIIYFDICNFKVLTFECR